jgi:hypothetical protein
MPCDTRLREGQTISQRKVEVREAIARLNSLLVSGRVKALVGPQGAVAFPEWLESDRARVTDACALRFIMSSGSALAKQAIARAEALAGRSIDKKAMAQGVHGHSDGHGGITWHHGH